MPGQFTLSGALQGGPPPGSDPSQGRSFINVLLALKGGAASKPFAEATGVISRNLSIDVFLQLSGIGLDDTVSKADTLYFFSNGTVDLRLTTDDGAGGDVVSQFTPDGLVVMEFSQLKFLKVLEARGIGTIEYFASGPS